MRRIAAVVIALMVIIGLAPAITAPTAAAERPFRWVKVGGDPRCTTPFRSAADAQSWFLSDKGQNDLARLGLSDSEREEATVRVRNSGVATVGLRRGNWVSWDGRTWERGEIRNLTFGRAGTVIRGPIAFVANVVQTRGYYPTGMTGWVPVAVADCCNMVLIKRQSPVAIIPPPPPAPPVPPPVVVTPPPPTPAPAPAPVARAFPLYIEVRAKDAQRSLRPVLVAVGSGEIANTTSSRSVRPLLDRNGNVIMFPSGSLEFWVDYRSARIVQTDSSTAALPDWKSLSDKGPAVGVGLYRPGSSEKCTGPEGAWIASGGPVSVRDDGTRLWITVEHVSTTRVIVELRSLPGQLGVVFHPFCRQPVVGGN